MSSMTMPTMSTFILPDAQPDVRVTHPASLSPSQLLEFPAFKIWLSTLRKSLALQHSQPAHPFHDSPYSLRGVEIQSVDFFSGRRLGFLKFKAAVTNDQGESLPGAVFMRGGSVAMLIVLTPAAEGEQTANDTNTREDTDIDSTTAAAAAAANTTRSPTTTTNKRREDKKGETETEPENGNGKGDEKKTEKDEEYVILTVQPRIAAGSLSFVELPAGMIDDSGTFAGAAAKEIREETGLEIATDELVDMSQLVMQETDMDTDTGNDESEPEPHLQAAVYPSPGGSDEFIPIFLVRKRLPRHEIDQLKGKLTGLRDHGEKITLKIVPLHQVWKVATRDGKTLAALALYQGLKGEGRI